MPRFNFDYDGDDEKWQRIHKEYDDWNNEQRANPERYKQRYLVFLKFILKQEYNTHVFVDLLGPDGKVTHDPSIELKEKKKPVAVSLHQSKHDIDIRIYFKPLEKYSSEKYLVNDFTDMGHGFESIIHNLSVKFDLPKQPNHIWTEIASHEEILAYKWSDLILFSDGTFVDRSFVPYPFGEMGPDSSSGDVKG